MDTDHIQDNLAVEPQAPESAGEFEAAGFEVLEPETLASEGTEIPEPIQSREAALNDNDYSALRERVIKALKDIYDPEIPVNIYDLGLIYGIGVKSPSEIEVVMTLTTPGCPVAQTFPEWVEESLLQIEGIESATVEIVWEPPWSMERMTEAARLELGML